MCQKGLVKCENCDETMERWQLERHMQICPKFKMNCNACGMEYAREDNMKHIGSICPEVFIKC